MTNLLQEFKSVSQLYSGFWAELSSMLSTASLANSQSLALSVLQNREYLERIGQMHDKVLQIADQWKNCRSGLDPQTRREIDVLAEDIRLQADRMSRLFAAPIEELKAELQRLREEMLEMGKGDRFLKSMKGEKSNYPKFVDTLS